MSTGEGAQARWLAHVEAGAAAPLWWRVSATALSWLYGAINVGRRLLYRCGILRSRRLPGKTLAIGNIAVGGTGKSPVALRIAELLLQAGARPVILSRGYGSGLKKGDSLAMLGGRLIMRPMADTVTLPDEGRMQSEQLPAVPVLAGPDRYAAARRLLSEHPELQPSHWLLDDGFQHWQLRRDMDLVLLDAACPFPRLLPRGRGRERASALRRAHVGLFTRCNHGKPEAQAVALAQSLIPGPVLFSQMVTEAPNLDVTGRTTFSPSVHVPAALVCGIARPEALIRTVQEDLGFALSTVFTSNDHQPIARQKVHSLAAEARCILTTAKDYWRDPTVFAALPVPVFVLPLRLSWDEAAVAAMIKRLL